MANASMVTHLNVLELYGESCTINSQTINILRQDNTGLVRECYGAAVPTDRGSGYAVGCFFFKTGAGAGTTLYVNEGSSTSCDFNAVMVGTTFIGLTDGPGSITDNVHYRGNAAGTALEAGIVIDTITPTSGNVLVADGTSFNSTTPNSANLMALTGNQTVAGDKTFSGNTTFSGTVAYPAGSVNEDDLKVYTADGLHARRVARATYDFAEHGGTAGTIGLGVTLPDNALIQRVWYKQQTAFTSGGAATVSFGWAGSTAALTTDQAFNHANYSEALHDGIQLGTVATMTEMTAAKEIAITIGTANLTAGKVIMFVEYVMVD